MSSPRGTVARREQTFECDQSPDASTARPARRRRASSSTARNCSQRPPTSSAPKDRTRRWPKSPQQRPVTKPILYRAVGDRRALTFALSEVLVDRINIAVEERRRQRKPTPALSSRARSEATCRAVDADRNLFLFVNRRQPGHRRDSRAHRPVGRPTHRTVRDGALRRLAATPIAARTWAYAIVGAFQVVTLMWLRGCVPATSTRSPTISRYCCGPAWRPPAHDHCASGVRSPASHASRSLRLLIFPIVDRPRSVTRGGIRVGTCSGSVAHAATPTRRPTSSGDSTSSGIHQPDEHLTHLRMRNPDTADIGDCRGGRSTAALPRRDRC